jgi:hypothetical protein
MEDNIEEIAMNIFTKPPGPCNSIQLQLEELTADIAMEQGVENFIFDILCLITHRGIQILFGIEHFWQISEQQFMLLREYTRSFGYEIRVFANDTYQSPWDVMRSGECVQRYNIFFDRIFSMV